MSDIDRPYMTVSGLAMADWARRYVAGPPFSPRVGLATPPPPVMARDVRVATIRQARCGLPGCEWSGELVASYQEANSDRQAHLEDHRRALAWALGKGPL